MSKRALGKGIDALLGFADDVESKETSAVTEVDINLLFPNPEQPRKVFKEESLKELADSIREQGIIQPIIVEKQGNKYLIIAGERRFRAAKIVELAKVPVIPRSFSREEKLEIALIENIQREDLSPIEEARAYRLLMDEVGLNQDELAKKVGKNRSTIANSLRLLKLPEDMQDAVDTGSMSAGHARSVLAVINPADQRILFNRILKDGLSVREAETQVNVLNKGHRPIPGKKAKPVTSKTPEIQNIEQKFIDVLGTKVLVKGNGMKGKIEISYFSMEDLERIFEIVAPDGELY